jgi:hypothetical protein
LVGRELSIGSIKNFRGFRIISKLQDPGLCNRGACYITPGGLLEKVEKKLEANCLYKESTMIGRTVAYDKIRKINK